ncbi:hypothetical protein [Anaeroselena agilis]|uniref:Uncharacterized protein n=1 Tax=Anaeroselena agilis TaxID=3063788 RepID=A0ABU3NUV8_9FIRM|nr:hypothetical protein [Selenomonadales bacterium 4137-cl]
MELLLFLVMAAAVVAVVAWLFIARQGDAEFDFLVDQRADFKLEEKSGDRAVFSCVVPFVNKGTQDGTIMDCFPRHLLPQEQFDAVEVSSRLELESRRRSDGYFESLIVPKTDGGAVIVTVVFTAKRGDVRQALADMVDMPIEIYFQIVARGRWYVDKRRVVMTADEVAAALKPAVAGA